MDCVSPDEYELPRLEDMYQRVVFNYGHGSSNQASCTDSARSDLQMSEYEVADYTAALMGNFLSAITIYFSIVTAYVVTAFAAGARLSSLQLIIVNTVFTIAAGIVGALTYLIFGRFYYFATLVNEQLPETPVVDFSAPIGLLLGAMYIGCLVFMWSTRRSKDDA